MASKRVGKQGGPGACDPEKKAKRQSPSNEAASAENCRDRLRAVIRRFHGEVGSPLAAVGLRLEMIRTRKGLDPQLAEELEAVNGDLAVVIDCVRESLSELRLLEQDAQKLQTH